MYAQYPQDDLPLDGEKFCQTLKSKKPSSCNFNSPPSAPGYDPNWQPNGCGTSGSQWLIDIALSITHTENYSGDPDAPHSGVSFWRRAMHMIVAGGAVLIGRSAIPGSVTRCGHSATRYPVQVAMVHAKALRVHTMQQFRPMTLPIRIMRTMFRKRNVRAGPMICKLTVVRSRNGGGPYEATNGVFRDAGSTVVAWM